MAESTFRPREIKGCSKRKPGEAYPTKGQSNRTVEAVWLGFLEELGPDIFRTLRKRTTAARDRSAWRQRTSDQLVIVHSQEKTATVALVEIFLFEGKSLDALREARRRPIFSRTWLVLADGLASPRRARARRSPFSKKAAVRHDTQQPQCAPRRPQPPRSHVAEGLEYTWGPSRACSAHIQGALTVVQT